MPYQPPTPATIQSARQPKRATFKPSGTRYPGESNNPQMEPRDASPATILHRQATARQATRQARRTTSERVRYSYIKLVTFRRVSRTRTAIIRVRAQDVNRRECVAGIKDEEAQRAHGETSGLFRRIYLQAVGIRQGARVH